MRGQVAMNFQATPMLILLTLSFAQVFSRYLVNKNVGLATSGGATRRNIEILVKNGRFFVPFLQIMEIIKNVKFFHLIKLNSIDIISKLHRTRSYRIKVMKNNNKKHRVFNTIYYLQTSNNNYNRIDNII